MSDLNLVSTLEEKFANLYSSLDLSSDMPCMELPADKLLEVAARLRAELDFHALMDVTAVDYKEYGQSDWRTVDPTSSGFSRGTDDKAQQVTEWHKPRFAVVYHLLSLEHNLRLRLKVFLSEHELSVPSVVAIWASADWTEREVFDMFGIEFTDHPDLRRILTDYGFKGHPFRKDFPLIGEVELRYDAAKKRCVYEPVSIQPRVLVPKVIRRDNRYKEEQHG